MEACIYNFARFLLFLGMLPCGALLVGFGMATGLPILFFICIAFAVESVTEIFYLSTFRVRQRSCHGKTISENTPLLTAGGLPVTEPRTGVQPLCQYPAIDIGSISSTDYKTGVLVKDLPIRTVQFPVDDLSKTAVLSWRWDLDDEQRSRNLATAIVYAQSVGINFVFADIVSIDQSLNPIDLIQQVITFSVLYKTIPVLAAYDQKGSALGRIMYRPWIFSELRSFAQNPTKVTYVGHNRQGSYVPWSAFCLVLGRPARSRSSATYFERQIQECWQTDYVISALHVLNGRTNIAQVFDFKIILPAFAEAFTRAEKLSRNDYLLTVVLLASNRHYGPIVEYSMETMFTALRYDNYRIKTRDNEKFSRKGRYISGKEIHTIFIGEKQIAGIQRIRKSYHKDYRIWTSVITEPTILDMLELSDTERQTYASRKEERRASICLPTEQGRTPIDVVAVRL
ncbi:MAG: hypothetical protein Q9198_005333 [Flavoplaca austrocitrina]